MATTPFFQMRISEADRRHLELLARRSQRSAADVLRQLIRATSPDAVTVGIPVAVVAESREAQPERERPAA